MSGHSKWSKIKRKKGANDAKRGKIFTRLIREITVAARQGGGEINENPRLRTAVLAARAQNMPADNIDRAIKKGTGELEGAHYEECTYEGYGPGGIALMIDVVTDNKQRTTPELRHLLSKNSGSLGEPGSVAWNFDTLGLLSVPKQNMDEDRLLELAMECGASDLKNGDEAFEVYTDAKDLFEVRAALESKSVKIDNAEWIKLPKTPVMINDKPLAESIVKLVEAIEEHDDVQSVFSSSEIAPEILEALGND